MDRVGQIGAVVGGAVTDAVEEVEGSQHFGCSLAVLIIGGYGTFGGIWGFPILRNSQVVDGVEKVVDQVVEAVEEAAPIVINAIADVVEARAAGSLSHSKLLFFVVFVRLCEPSWTCVQRITPTYMSA